MEFRNFFEQVIGKQEFQNINRLSSILYKYIKAAFDRYYMRQQQNPVDEVHRWGQFIAALKETWPGTHKAGRFYLPQGMPFSSMPIKINSDFDSEVGSYGNSFDMKIGVGRLLRATNPAEANIALQTTLAAISHEPVHLYRPGAELDGEDVSATIQYLSNRGEMEANAYSYARLYDRAYPRQPFDLGKLQALSQKLGNPTMINYFVKFNDPQRQQKYAQFKIGAVAEEMESLVKSNLDRIRQTQQSSGLRGPQIPNRFT